MEKVYLIYAASFDSEPRVRFVSDTKGFASNIKEAKVMTSDEAYEAYCRLNIYYRLNVIETTGPGFAALRWDIHDNCPVNEITHLDMLSNPEEYLKPKVYNCTIHYDNKFYYCITTFESGYENDHEFEYFMPDREGAKVFYSKTEKEMLSVVKDIQSKFPNVKLEICKYNRETFKYE